MRTVPVRIETQLSAIESLPERPLGHRTLQPRGGRVGICPVVRAAAILTVATLALSGCTLTSSSASGSRHKLYESVEELVADSTAVVVATATEQAREDYQVVTRIEVEQALDPAGIATAAPARQTPLSPPQELVVRQLDNGTEEGVLEPGRRYLLFLNPTMLDGAAADHFYVVGSVAGVFLAEGHEFRRMSTVDADLPDTLTVGELVG
jgi:hypothetical protein